MPPLPNLSLAPLIGHAMQQLGLGLSPQAVVAWLGQRAEYARHPQSDLQTAVQYASSNRSTLIAARAQGGAASAAGGSAGRLIPGEQVGYNVIIYGTDRGGRQKHGMVTINAPSDMPLVEVANLARHAVVTGQLTWLGSGSDMVDFEPADIESIVSIIEGGHERPALMRTWADVEETLAPQPSAGELLANLRTAREIAAEITEVPEGLTAEQWAEIQLQLKYGV